MRLSNIECVLCTGSKNHQPAPAIAQARSISKGFCAQSESFRRLPSMLHSLRQLDRAFQQHCC
jgi:hypothetical protein